VHYTARYRQKVKLLTIRESGSKKNVPSLRRLMEVGMHTNSQNFAKPKRKHKRPKAPMNLMEKNPADSRTREMKQIRPWNERKTRLR
jgi:SOS-response transcriptional repressor LexA